MLKKRMKKLRKQDGMVIVEASFVFPIMFIILFFLIYMGNAYYIKAQVEAVTSQYAIVGANSCADPLLETVKQTGSVPALKDLKTEPYRYIFGGMSDIEAKISNDVKNKINLGAGSFFKNMNPKIVTPDNEIAQFHNFVVYSTFSVEVRCEVQFPIRFFGEDAPPVLVLCSRSEVAVNDTTEFIRNTDMVIDLFHGTKVGQNISDVFGKINNFISSFAGK